MTCVAWNCQVQHILASTFPARCVVWDLRKNEPIIKVSDSSARVRTFFNIFIEKLCILNYEIVINCIGSEKFLLKKYTVANVKVAIIYMEDIMLLKKKKKRVI